MENTYIHSLFESRSINTQGQYPDILASRLINKGLILYGEKTIFLCRTADNLERHLGCLGSQSKPRISFIFPAHGASDMITKIKHYAFNFNCFSKRIRVSVMIADLTVTLLMNDMEPEFG